MPSTSDESMRPTSFASAASFFNDDGIGSSVNVMLLNDDVTIGIGSGLPVILSIPSETSFFASAGSLLIRSIESESPLMQRRDLVGVILEELRGHDEVAW